MEKKFRHHFSQYIYDIVVYFRHSRVANSVVGGKIWPKFTLIQDVMYASSPESFRSCGSRKGGDIDSLDVQGQLTP